MSRPRILGGRRDRRGASVDMAPLIDMVFILLIFFMVSTTFVRESGVEITRPQSALAQSVDPGFVPVAIDKRGSVHIGGRLIPADSIRDVANTLRETNRTRIVIQADRDVPTHILLKVLDTCRLAGAKQVDVAALKD
jgi:biopolymer transport protein ExbD